jgi:LuxR family maltose regulon positive regulatory protein
MIRVTTLGQFVVWLGDIPLSPQDWSRQTAQLLFKYFICRRNSKEPIHKTSIIEDLWPEIDSDKGDRNFKVALNALSSTLEPHRQARQAYVYIKQEALYYSLAEDDITIDADIFENHIKLANRLLQQQSNEAINHYRIAIDLYQGHFMPTNFNEDWCYLERERLQVLYLGAATTLAELEIEQHPMECIRLCDHILALDPVWEVAYRLQMRAYLATGNRPLAIKRYHACLHTLEHEMGIEPMPQTQQLFTTLNTL